MFRINLATGAATTIGPISGGLHDINGLAYRSDGFLVALDRVTNSLLLIDPTTAVSSLLAPIRAVVGGVGGMSVSGGVGYFSTSGPGGSAPGSNELYTFDLFTGQQTLIGSFAPTITGPGISGLAAYPIPESSSALFLSLGLIAIWICVSRRPRLGTSESVAAPAGDAFGVRILRPPA